MSKMGTTFIVGVGAVNARAAGCHAKAESHISGLRSIFPVVEDYCHVDTAEFLPTTHEF